MDAILRPATFYPYLGNVIQTLFEMLPLQTKDLRTISKIFLPGKSIRFTLPYSMQEDKGGRR
jgi:hypothetical protein